MKLLKYLAVVCLASTTVLWSCKPDYTELTTFSKPEEANVAITETKVDDSKYKFSVNTPLIGNAFWKIGNGHVGNGDFTDTFYDIGEYSVELTFITKGGIVTKKGVHKQTVADPIFGNLVKGGKFANAEDHAKWTVLTISAAGAKWVFEDGKASLTASGYSGQGIYQTIDVVKDRTYKIDMLVSSESGLSESWFEVYISPTAPTQGADYNADGKKRSINTWDGCGGSAFSGLISNIGCKADDNKGLFTAKETGKVYLVIRGGGNDMKKGLSITNVEFRSVKTN